MLGKYAAAYVMVIGVLDQIISQLEDIAKNPRPPSPGDDMLALALMGKERKLDKSVGEGVDRALKSIMDSLYARMSFPSATAQTKRISGAIANGAGPRGVAAMTKELKQRLLDELDERQFLYVPPELERYYKDPMLMGREVNDRFPQAIDDIEGAGKCLALQEGTACVLHTMRVMEVGLKALGAALKIPYAPSWESYLKQIADKIALKHKNKTKAWKRDERFYRDLSGDLLTVKQAWRNPTMHVDRKYAPHEAEQIFQATTHFMQRLAKHFCEKEMAKLLRG